MKVAGVVLSLLWLCSRRSRLTVLLCVRVETSTTTTAGMERKKRKEQFVDVCYGWWRRHCWWLQHWAGCVKTTSRKEARPEDIRPNLGPDHREGV